MLTETLPNISLPRQISTRRVAGKVTGQGGEDQLGRDLFSSTRPEGAGCIVISMLSGSFAQAA